MGSGQVSIWVTVTVAVLGIVGVIAGQLVNAWREDRRWRRELQREDLRFDRETSREQKRTELEHTHQWRDERLAAYSEFLGAFDRYGQALQRVLFRLWTDQPVSDELEEEVAAARQGISEPMARVHLVASDATHHECFMALSHLTHLKVSIDQGAWEEDGAIHPNGTHIRVVMATRAARRALRADLGLETEAENDATNNRT